MLFIVMKSSLPVYNIVEEGGRGGGERGFANPMMSLGIVPKIPCQRIILLSDPGVPRTFVVDCTYMYKPSNVVFGIILAF